MALPLYRSVLILNFDSVALIQVQEFCLFPPCLAPTSSGLPPPPVGLSRCKAESVEEMLQPLVFTYSIFNFTCSSRNCDSPIQAMGTAKVFDWKDGREIQVLAASFLLKTVMIHLVEAAAAAAEHATPAPPPGLLPVRADDPRLQDPAAVSPSARQIPAERALR